MSSDSLSSTDSATAASGLLIRKSEMEARAEHQTERRFQMLYWGTVTLGAVVSGLVVFWTLYYRGGFGWSDVNLKFNWHPMLMTVGMIFMFGNAILIYRAGRQYRKKSLKLTHAIINFAAFVFAVIALKAVFDFHNYSDPPKPNLYTLHSWIGLLAVILFGLQFLVGFVSFLFPGLPIDLRAALMPAHVYFGAAIFLLVIVAGVLGLAEKAIFSLSENYSRYTNEGLLINTIGILLVSFGALVLYLVGDVTFKRVSIAPDEIGLTGAHNE